MEASRCAYKRNIILKNVRQHNHFITQGNYIATCFDYRLVIFRHIFLNWVTRCYVHALHVHSILWLNWQKYAWRWL